MKIERRGKDISAVKNLIGRVGKLVAEETIQCMEVSQCVGSMILLTMQKD